MCIALLVRKDAELPSDEVLQSCFDNNDDSCGFSYISTDDLGRKRLKVHKYMEYEPFLHKLKRCYRIEGSNSPFMLHFRIQTSGIHTTFNQHPFMVNDDLCFCHNGIITSSVKDFELNDTQVFNRDILKELPDNFLDSIGITDMIEDYIGHSKLIFLDVDGRYDILNEHLGTWSRGVWFSNDSHKRKAYSYANWKKPIKKTKGTQAIPYQWTYNSPVICDKCHGSFNIFKCTAYDVYSTIDIYCKECEEEVLEDGVVYASELCKYGVYLDFKNGLPTRYEEDLESISDVSGSGWSEHTGAYC